MSKVCMVYGGTVTRCNSTGTLLAGTKYVIQSEIYDGSKVSLGFVIAVDTLYFFIPEDMGVIVDPTLHRIGSADPAKDAYDKHCRNISDYTKAYKAFGKDRMLDYQVQVDKNRKIDETSRDESKVQG